MKSAAGFYFLFTAMASAAALPPLDAFKDGPLNLPTLTLEPSTSSAGNYLRSQPNSLGGPATLWPAFSQVSPKKELRGRRSFSMIGTMPVIQPDPAVNYQLTIRPADVTLDPKMVVPGFETPESPAVAQK